MNSKKFFDWCRTAVSSIKRWPQKDEIQKELYTRLEAHYSIFLDEGYTHEESEDKALAAMGDAQVVAAQLEKAYKPMWPKLLIATRIGILISALAAFFVVMAFVRVDDIANITQIDLMTEGIARYVLHPNVSQHSDGYTMTVKRVAYEPYMRDPSQWYTISLIENLLLVDIVVTHPQMWLCPPVTQEFWAVDNEGKIYDVGVKVERNHDDTATHTGLLQYTHQLSIEAVDGQRLDWIELHCDSDGRNLVWRIDLPGGDAQ